MQHLAYRSIITNHMNLIGSLIFVVVLVPLFMLMETPTDVDPESLAGIALNSPVSLTGSGVLPLLILIAAVAILFYLVLWVKMYKYETTDVSFEKEYGVIAKNHVSIPYHHIQNVDIKRGILERILGISSVEIQTAGSEVGGAEGVLPGISKRKAKQLQDELLERADKKFG